MSCFQRELSLATRARIVVLAPSTRLICTFRKSQEVRVEAGKEVRRIAVRRAGSGFFDAGVCRPAPSYIRSVLVRKQIGPLSESFGGCSKKRLQSY